MSVFCSHFFVMYLLGNHKEHRMEDEQINKIKFVSEDSFYIEELKKGNIKAFEFIFNKYYKDLVYFCNVF